jgi:hypothetical protein
MVKRGSPLIDRLRELAPAGDPKECWNWTGTIHYSGYGWLQYKGDQKGAHVWAYIEAYGPVPEGLMVLHSCDNRPCVNPGHLRAGTHDENMADKVERDRCARLLGELGPSRKITEAQAVEIIQRYAVEDISSGKLGAGYGISASQVQYIVNGKRWPHLDRITILAQALTA